MRLLQFIRRIRRTFFDALFLLKLKWNSRKAFIWVTAVLLPVILCVSFVGYSSQAKQVVLVVDGEVYEVETKQSSVIELLQEQNIRMKEQDFISMSLTDEIQHGDRLLIQRATRVEVVDYGIATERYTTAKTVGGALQQFGVKLREHDEVIPSLDQPLSEDLTIQIERVDKLYKVEKQTIPFETIEQQDEKLVKGKKEVRQQGKEGTIVKTIEQVWKNQQLIAEHVIDEVIEQEKQDEIIAVGTRAPVQILSASSANKTYNKNGITFSYRSVLDNVTLTAYDAGYNSTGKSEGDPGYGITYTGAVVQEGRTASVDPDVIPLGWWFYIEGIGFRKAEDIGSAIKGKKIDIYMESESEANRFGRKRGYTVYIIGPEKPSALQ